MAVASLVVRVSAQVAEFQKSFAQATRTTEKFERDFANTASSVSAQQKRISDAFASFSGDRLAREASAVAKAVEQIGGASKLTAKEQANVNALMTEAIAKYAALGQTAPKSVTDIEKATRKLETALVDTQKVVDKTEDSGFFTDLATQVKATALGFISAQAVIGGFQAAFRGVTQFVGSSVQSFAAAEAAQSKLAAALRASGQAVPVALKQFDDLATEFQRTTVFSDDLVTEMQALLVQVGGVLPSQMRGALDAATDLSAGLGIELRESTLLVAKAFAGGGDELGRLKAILGDSVVAGSGMAGILDAINSKFGGQAAAQIDTYAGKMQLAANAWDNFKESVGKAIIEDPKVTAVLNAMTEAATNTGGAAKKTGTTVEGSMRQIGNAAASGQPMLAYLAALNFALDAAATNYNNTVEAARLLEKANPPALQFSTTPQFAPGSIDVVKYLKDVEDQQKKAKTAADDHAAAVKGIADRISGADVVAKVKLWQEALRSTGAPARVLADETLRKELGGALDAITHKFRSLNAAGVGSLTGMQAALKAMSQQAETIPPKIIETLDVFRLMPVAARDFAAENTKTTATLQDMVAKGIHLKDVGPAVFKGMRDEAAKANQQVKSLSDTLQSDLLRVLSNVPQTIANAFTGGGGFGGALKSIGTQIASTISGSIGAAFGPLGEQIGSALGSLVGGLVGQIGGPSRDELLGRDVVAQFEQTLQGTLTAQQKLDAGNESWKLTTIAVRDAYISAGRTASEAERAVAKLWDSSRIGADASRLAVLEIQAVMDIAAEKQRQLGDEQVASADRIEDATSGIKQRIADLTSEYDSLFNSIKNEAPEDVIGIVESLARERLRAIEVERTGLEREMDAVTKQVEDNLTGLSETAKATADEIEKALSNIRIETIRIPIEISGAGGLQVPALASGGIVRKPTLALIGESGPEAVVPLGSGGVGSSQPIVVQTYLDGRLVAESTARHLPYVLGRMG
jgi:hypothetical protein